MSWSYAIYDTLTGVRQAAVSPVSNSMGRLLNAGSSGSTVLLPQEGVSRDQFKALTTPWARTLVKFWKGAPLFAHLITGRSWDFSSGRLSLDHADIWALLARRTTFGVDGYSGNDPTDNKLEMLGFSYESMPQWLVWAGTEGPTANYGLPVYLPGGKLTYALLNSTPHSGPGNRTYYDYEVHFVEPAIREILSVGPDADFEPRIVGGLLQLHMHVGALGGTSSDWNMTAPKPELFDVTDVEDASKQANVIHVIGKGSEADMRVRSASAAPGSGIPALERVVNLKDQDDYGILQNHANSSLALYNQPTRQINASMFADAGKGIENMPPSHVMRLYFKDHPWEPDGWTTLRIVGFSTDETTKVQLSIQPTGGV